MASAAELEAMHHAAAFADEEEEIFDFGGDAEAAAAPVGGADAAGVGAAAPDLGAGGADAAAVEAVAPAVGADAAGAVGAAAPGGGVDAGEAGVAAPAAGAEAVARVGELGPPARVNAQRESQKSDWLVTVMNWSEEERQALLTWEQAAYVIVGKEIAPTTGTPHLQGYVELHGKCRLAQLKDFLPRANWKPRGYGKAEWCANYCKKDGDWEESGTLSTWRKAQALRDFWVDIHRQVQAHDSFNGVLNDPALAPVVSSKLAWAKAVYAARPQEPVVLDPSSAERYWWQARFETFLTQTAADDRTVHWVVDEEGNLGKTRFCKFMCQKHGALLGANDYRSDCSLYSSATRIVLIDIPRSEETCDFRAVEMFKNGLCVQTKYEVEVKTGTSCHVVVFSNSYPNLSKLSEDRWNLVSGHDLRNPRWGLTYFFPPHRFPQVAHLRDPMGTPQLMLCDGPRVISEAQRAEVARKRAAALALREAKRRGSIWKSLRPCEQASVVDLDASAPSTPLARARAPAPVTPQAVARPAPGTPPSGAIFVSAAPASALPAACAVAVPAPDTPPQDAIFVSAVPAAASPAASAPSAHDRAWALAKARSPGEPQTAAEWDAHFRAQFPKRQGRGGGRGRGGRGCGSATTSGLSSKPIAAALGVSPGRASASSSASTSAPASARPVAAPPGGLLAAARAVRVEAAELEQARFFDMLDHMGRSPDSEVDHIRADVEALPSP